MKKKFFDDKLSVLIAVLCVVAVICTIPIIMWFVGSNKERKLSENLEFGRIYLDEADYEDAIIAFSSVIESDPLCIDGYIGLADAYVGAGDYEAAKEILEKGLKVFADAKESSVYSDALQAKLDVVQSEIDKIASGNLLGDEAIDEEINEEIVEESIGIEENSEITEENVEINDDLSDLPYIEIKPLQDSLNNVWGRKWIDWTYEDFIKEKTPIKMEIDEYMTDVWVSNYESEERFDADYAKYTAEEFVYNNEKLLSEMITPYIDEFHETRSASGLWILCYPDGKYLLKQDIISASGSDPIKSNLYSFCEERNLTDVDSVMEFFGFDLETFESAEFNSDLGTGTISKTYDEESGYLLELFLDKPDEVSDIIFNYNDNTDGRNPYFQIYVSNDKVDLDWWYVYYGNDQP